MFTEPRPLSAPRKNGAAPDLAPATEPVLAMELLSQYSIHGNTSRNTPTSKHT